MDQHLLVLRAGQLFLVFIERPLVPEVEQDEQDAVDREPLRPQSEGPGEGHAFQEAEEQWRVADGGEEAAAVRDNKDDEDDDVGDAFAPLVGPQQGPDQQHRRTGRAEHVGEHGADAEHAGIDEWRPGQRALNVNPARDHEKRADDHDEAQILVEFLVQRLTSRLAQVEPEVDDNREREGGRDERLVAVLMPPVRRDEWQQRDRQEQRDEGQGSDERKLGAEHKLAPCCY